jgi:hypothetical protein
MSKTAVAVGSRVQASCIVARAFGNAPSRHATKDRISVIDQKYGS